MHLKIKKIKNDDYDGKTVSIKGWIHRIRKQKENSFFLIRDHRGDVIQCIYSTSKLVNDLTIESSVEVSGIVQKDTRAPEGGYEIKAATIKVFNIAEQDYPIGEYQSLDLLLEKRHLAMRTRRMIMISKIRASVLYHARNWFINNDWMEITPPIIVKGSVEGGSTLFNLKYFDDVAFLSQSAQLYLESMIFSLGPVWSLTTSFRAEKSRTIRHLSEFQHLEAEAPWVDLDDILNIQENLVSFIVKNVIKQCKSEFEFLKRDLAFLENIYPSFSRLKYEQAIKILRDKDHKILDRDIYRFIEYGDDLSIDSERILTEDSATPLFVIGYPLNIKPFYVKEDPNCPGVGVAADLLAPYGYGEITSGGLREDNLNSLTKRMILERLKTDDYQWYLDLRRYGSVPHGGFGLGIERLMRWILDINDIKDTIPFPRTMSRINP